MGRDKTRTELEQEAGRKAIVRETPSISEPLILGDLRKLVKNTDREISLRLYYSALDNADYGEVSVWGIVNNKYKLLLQAAEPISGFPTPALRTKIQLLVM